MKYVKGKNCRQGICSFCIDQNLMASKCSNISERVPYTNLEETWQKITESDRCLFEGNNDELVQKKNVVNYMESFF